MSIEHHPDGGSHAQKLNEGAVIDCTCKGVCNLCEQECGDGRTFTLGVEAPDGEIVYKNVNICPSCMTDAPVGKMINFIKRSDPTTRRVHTVIKGGPHEVSPTPLPPSD